MFSGKPEPSKIRSGGGNHEREAFREKVSKVSPMGGDKMPAKESGGSSGETSIKHEADGTHTVKHADGEETKHPNMGHALMTVHAKHSASEGHHIESHPDGKHTSHHADMAGMVSGPHEHEDGKALMDHMGQMVDEHEGMGPIDTSSAGPGTGADEGGLY